MTSMQPCATGSGGLDFLVGVEAKNQRNSVKRSVVQTLHAKMMSVGAQKGVVVATAPFQRGALEYASVHGIALVLIAGGDVNYLMHMMSAEVMRRHSARLSWGLEGQCWHYLAPGF